MDNESVYDLIVIGTGTAGSTVASSCRSKGLRVAIIDSLHFGGTCALRGCEPKKILIEAAKAIDANHRHENKGISEIDKVHLNWRDLINFKKTFTEPFPKQREDSYIKAGIIPIHGKAKFIGKDTIKVKFNNTDEEHR